MMSGISGNRLKDRIRSFFDQSLRGQSIGDLIPSDSTVVPILVALMVAGGGYALYKGYHGLPDQPIATTQIVQGQVRDFIYKDLGMACHQVDEASVQCETPTDISARLAQLLPQGETMHSELAKAHRWFKEPTVTIVPGADKGTFDWGGRSSLVAHFDTNQLCHIHEWSTRNYEYAYGLNPDGKYGYGYRHVTHHHDTQSCVPFANLSESGQARMETLRNAGLEKPADAAANGQGGITNPAPTAPKGGGMKIF